MKKAKNIFDELDKNLADQFGQVPDETEEEFAERVIGDLFKMFEDDQK